MGAPTPSAVAGWSNGEQPAHTEAAGSDADTARRFGGLERLYGVAGAAKIRDALKKADTVLSAPDAAIKPHR